MTGPARCASPGLVRYAFSAIQAGDSNPGRREIMLSTNDADATVTPMRFMAYRYRVYPTLEQLRLFLRTVGCCRFVYN